MKQANTLQLLYVYKQICVWNLTDNVKGMCFDRTASNTGRQNGARVLPEQIWKQNRYSFLVDTTFLNS